MEEADYSVLGYFLQTPFERRKLMFSSFVIRKPMTVVPHRQFEWQKQINAQKMASQASIFEATHRR